MEIGLKLIWQGVNVGQASRLPSGWRQPVATSSLKRSPPSACFPPPFGAYYPCDPSHPLKILVAITGASGSLYAQRLLDNLDPQAHEIHVVMSNYAHQVVATELPGGLKLPAGVTAYGLKSMNVPFASGSNPPDAMVIIPCTMGTLGRVAHGFSEDVLTRAADVALKERR